MNNRNRLPAYDDIVVNDCVYCALPLIGKSRNYTKENKVEAFRVTALPPDDGRNM